MNPPLTENYCSTIDIAEASVCEVPVSKVTKWIENNNFQHSGYSLASKSFNSLATSQMITYICENDKRKGNDSCTLLPDYIEETNCQQYRRKTDDDLKSIQSLPPLSCVNHNCNLKPTQTSPLYPFYNGNALTNIDHLPSDCGGSSPKYLREAGHQSGSDGGSSIDMSLSLDSTSLSGITYQSKRPQDLQINTEKYMPYVSDSNCLKTNSDFAPQISCKDDDDDSGLNTATTAMELSETQFGYFDILSDKVKPEVDTASNSCQSSTSNLFVCDSEIDDTDHRVVTFSKLTLNLKSVLDDNAPPSPVGSSTNPSPEHYFDMDTFHCVRKVSSSGLSSGYVGLPLENYNTSSIP